MEKETHPPFIPPLHVVLHIIFKTHLLVINQSGGEKQVHDAQIMAIFRWKSWSITLSTRQTPAVSRRSPINNTTFYTPRRATATHLLRAACANLLCVCMCVPVVRSLLMCQLVAVSPQPFPAFTAACKSDRRQNRRRN